MLKRNYVLFSHLSMNHNSSVCVPLWVRKVCHVPWNCQGNVREFRCVWKVVSLWYGRRDIRLQRISRDCSLRRSPQHVVLRHYDTRSIASIVQWNVDTKEDYTINMALTEKTEAHMCGPVLDAVYWSSLRWSFLLRMASMDSCESSSYSSLFAGSWSSCGAVLAGREVSSVVAAAAVTGRLSARALPGMSGWSAAVDGRPASSSPGNCVPPVTPSSSSSSLMLSMLRLKLVQVVSRSGLSTAPDYQRIACMREWVSEWVVS